MLFSIRQVVCDITEDCSALTLESSSLLDPHKERTTFLQGFSELHPSRLESSSVIQILHKEVGLLFWLFLRPYLCEKEGSWLACNEQFVTGAAVERKPYCWCFEEEDGEASCTVWNKQAVSVLWSAEWCDNIKYPVLRPSVCIVNLCLCTTEICNKNCCCYSP
jgi:hypothetical protein